MLKEEFIRIFLNENKGKREMRKTYENCLKGA